MHEASVAKDVLEIILETIDNDADLRGKTVNAINFALSYPPTVAADSFEFYFIELIKGTIIEGARLNFELCEHHGFFINSLDVD